VLSVTVDIVLAVFLGVAIAALLFMGRMSRSVIRRAYRCTAVRSRKLRPAAELEVLGRTGSAVLVMELQGALFFGSAEKLAAEIAAQAAEGTRYVILDLRRITEIDSTGQQTLGEIQAELAAQSKLLLLCLADSAVTDAVKKERIFPDLDRAIQWTEDELLHTEPKAGEAAEMRLAQAAMLTGFSDAEAAALEKHMKRVVHKAGHVLFREGEPGKELFIIVKGTASAFLPQEKGADIRLVTFATGTVFGELAILDSGARSATVIADSELVCYVLKEKDFAAMAEDQPELAIKLLSGLARQLSHRLRSANRTIEQLEE
jgi:CRP-like cAMP-binding protein/anti-anti-sigma regulatory factor